MKELRTLLLFWTLSHLGLAYQEDVLYQYDDDNDTSKETYVKEEEVKRTPSFVSKPITMYINEGDTIRLPCLVDRKEGFVLIWKRNHNEIITLDEQIIDKTVRIEVKENGNYLVIPQAGPLQEANYTCEISAWKPPRLTHTVRIRTEPEIDISPEGEVSVPSGEGVTLTCTARAGYPEPQLQWKRVGVDGVTVGGVIQIESVARSDAGQYTCEASNGYKSEPVTKTLNLDVQYAPVILEEDEQMLVIPGDTVESSCTADSNPIATVTWVKDGDTDSNIAISDSPTLEMTNITTNMLGIYTCIAENNIGRATKSLNIEGLSGQVDLINDLSSNISTTEALQWTVESVSPVESFEVKVKSFESEEWKSYIVEPLDGDENTTNTFSGELELTNLSPNTTYSFQISTRNGFGFNTPEQVFHFTTEEEQVWEVEEEDSETTSLSEDVDTLTTDIPVTSSSATFLPFLLSYIFISLFLML